MYFDKKSNLLKIKDTWVIVGIIIVSLILSCTDNKKNSISIAKTKNLNSNNFTLIIELDSFNKYSLGNNIHSTIHCNFQLKNDSLFHHKQNQKVFLSDFKKINERSLQFVDYTSPIILTTLKKKLINNVTYYPIMFHVTTDRKDLLILMDEKLKIQSCAFGWWNSRANHFEYFFYQGDSSKLAKIVELQSINELVKNTRSRIL